MMRTELPVKDLTTMYANGEIAIPEIQRDFVWKAKKIKEFVDSIGKDYPSGAIILWRPAVKGPELELLIKPEKLDLYKKKKKMPTYLLVDGQQRLTALCSVILPAEEVIDSLGEEVNLPSLYINAKTLAVEERADPSHASNNEVLLNRVLSAEKDDSGLMVVLGELSGRKDISAAHKNGLKEFRDRVWLYTYPVHILDGHSYATVADIFRRVNSGGKPLVTAELTLATIVPHWKGSAGQIRKFMKEMRPDKKMGCEGFDAGLPFYLRCLAFIATNQTRLDKFSKQVKEEAKNGPLNTWQLQRNWNRTKKAVKRLAGSLKTSGINRTKLITSQNAMVPMVYALANDPKGKVGDGILAKWLVLAMVGGHYSKMSETVLKRDSAPLTNSRLGIDQRFEKLYRQMVKDNGLGSRYKFGREDFEGPAFQNAAMLCIYLCLRHKGAIDFNGKASCPIGEIGEYHVHHIFPVEFMREDPDALGHQKREELSWAEFKEQINEVANLTFISPEANQKIKKRAPFDYFDDPDVTNLKYLETHCIPTDPELWRPENFDRFCEERKVLLAKAMNSYMRSLDE